MDVKTLYGVPICPHCGSENLKKIEGLDYILLCEGCMAECSNYPPK